MKPQKPTPSNANQFTHKNFRRVEHNFKRRNSFKMLLVGKAKVSSTS